MNRLVLTLGLVALAGPLYAWEFSPDPVCTLLHTEPQAEVRVTYDPLAMLYAIDVQAPVPWPQAPVFAIRFDGPRALAISTDRHQLSDQDRTLTVADTGFGNVLDGLQFNTSATAQAGDASVTFSLEGAAENVEAFRACAEALAV